MTIYIVRTTAGREDIVVDLIAAKIKSEGLAVKAVLHPAEIKGYVFVEGQLDSVQKAVHGLMHIKGIITKPVTLDQIARFLEYKKERIKVEIGDIVEIIGGPFKGEKGKVQRIGKEEVTVELLEAAIPIPVTIATEFVKVIKPAEKV
jgi:transcriptional antiterminator NusG